MALSFVNCTSSIILPVFLALFIFMKCYECFNPKNINESMYDQGYDFDWSVGAATWYGASNGAGSDGGACGFRDAVGKPPYSGMISAGGPSIYDMGQGCGVCYQVKCTENEACSGDAVRITITDECPGCTKEAAHFDLSGSAFGALAKPGLADQLRNAGVLYHLQYKMVKCDYPGVTVVLRVDPGSNPYYFATSIEYADGTGIEKVELQPQSSDGWLSMYESFGATWAINSGDVLQPPFSIRLTEKVSLNTLILTNVIPLGWQPGQTYRSHVNFNGN
ncbi:hypothetical protein RND81_01G187400 [Saponaria officinalis]|uniref:Uncharacterized protein n=1 Tax=Saponaria officinalis TaxID=3572 RepID=A0AAW1NFH2_SAPOF